jgi:hypothetical protein
MKAIRKITNSNKALMSFGLVLFFLFAGWSKSFASPKTTAGIHKKEVNAGASILAAENDCDAQDQLKAFDSDSDDFEYTFFGETVAYRFLSPAGSDKSVSSCNACKNSFTLPLYDLFCNWKLHIS